MVVITRSHPDASPLSSDEVVHHAPGSNRLLPGSGASLLPARAVCLSCLPEGGQRREPPPYPVNGARMRKVDRVGGRLGSNGRGLSAVGRLLRSRVPGTALLLMPQGGMCQSVCRIGYCVEHVRCAPPLRGSAWACRVPLHPVEQRLLLIWSSCRFLPSEGPDPGPGRLMTQFSMHLGGVTSVSLVPGSVWPLS